MTATTHSPTAAVEACPVCHGSGEVVTDDVDPETGFHGAEACDWCNGDSTVPAGSCTLCEACGVPMFIDDTCRHRAEALCDTCQLERCEECRADAEDDRVADVWADIIRGGAR